jgi:hypothetical protein
VFLSIFEILTMQWGYLIRADGGSRVVGYRSREKTQAFVKEYDGNGPWIYLSM